MFPNTCNSLDCLQSPVTKYCSQILFDNPLKKKKKKKKKIMTIKAGH